MRSCKREEGGAICAPAFSMIDDDGDEMARDGEAVRVGLLVTCLVDVFRPSVGFAAARLLEEAGCEVIVPPQTCCGQPAYNSGDRASARDLARAMMDAFANVDHVVAPSGSCAGMAVRHYPELFADDPALGARARAFAAKTHELTSFLYDVLGVRAVDAAFARPVAYHDSCAGLRELGVREQPRALLRSVEGLTLAEMKDADVCCGFGGTFAVKYGDISDAIVSAKADCAQAACAGAGQEGGAGVLLAGDLGCLMNIAGKLARRGSNVEVRHVAEVLADMTQDPPIAGGADVPSR